MTLSLINSVIASLKSSTVTLIERGRAPLVQGRVGVAPVTLTSITDVVHYPDPSTAAVKTRDSVSASDRMAFAFRVEARTAVINPDGSSAWWVLHDGKMYEIESVEDWTAGGFWLAHASRIREWSMTSRVFFGSVPLAVRNGLASETLTWLQANRHGGYVDSGGFRFATDPDVADVGLFIFIELPFNQTYEGHGANSFRAIDGDTVDEDVVDLGVSTVDAQGSTWLFASLDLLTDDDGICRYEVIG